MSDTSTQDCPDQQGERGPVLLAGICEVSVDKRMQLREDDNPVLW